MSFLLSLTLFFLVRFNIGQKGPKGKAPPTPPPITVTAEPTAEPTSNPVGSSPTTPLPTSNPVLAPTSNPTADICLRSPNDLVWTQQGGDFVGSLNYGVSTFEYNIGGQLTIFTVRTFDDSIPLPTMRMERGKRYLLNVANNLGPESPNNPTTNNVLKDPNTTNIHTHGLHISGDQLADNVFTTIAPGQSHTFDYRIPCEHAAGTHWYHPHHHGSTTLQVGSGAAGFIFINEDSPTRNIEGLPEWLEDINANNPLDLIIQHIHLDTISQLYNTNVDRVTSYTGANEFTLLNGQYQPTVCLNSGEWRRINMLYVNILDDITIRFVSVPANSGECRILLLARDGVLLHGENNQTPRIVTELLFSVASRADILITCDPGTYNIRGGGAILGFILASGTSLATDAPNLPVFNPVRPSYLTNLLTATPQNTQIIRLAFDGLTQIGSVNNQPFNGDPNTPLFSIDVNTVQQWDIRGAGVHPYHQHINHFQLTQDGAGNDLRGDWFDVLHTNNIVRFRTDLFGGKMVLHCHILEHEDKGLMAVININDGCDYQFTSSNTCNYNWPC